MGLPDWLLCPPPGAVIAISDGPHGPATVPRRLGAEGALRSWRVLSGWLVGAEPDWLAMLGPAGGWSVMGSGGARAAVRDGRLRYLPVRLSQMPKILSGPVRPEVAVVRARPAGRGFVLAPSVGWALAACRSARRIVVEADPSLPDIEAPEVPGRPDLVVESEVPAVQPAIATVDDTDRRIGKLVASVIPDGATVQHGPGSIAEAVIAALDRPVRVFSGMVTDSLVTLADRGLLAESPAVAAYLHGSPALERLAAAGAVRVTGVEETHDLGAVAAIERFTALNTAIQVGLDGAVNVEGVGERSIAGVGGHPDYALAASLSPGGISVIALRAATVSGVPTIVPRADRISTSPTDVDIVVTEHGLADLRGRDRFQRREALLAIAGPP